MVRALLDLSKQHVAVIGGGTAGRAVAALARDEGARVAVLDDNEGAERDGAISVKAIAAADVAFLSPGVPRAHPEVAECLRAGQRLFNEVELAAARWPHARFFGVTGTNGKSTTTPMVESILKAHDSSALAGGNLGTPLVQWVREGKTPSAVCVELSSYQLETIEALPLSAAVITQLAPDHLDRYENVESYYQTKAKIFSLVTRAGGAAINARDANSQAHLAGARSGRAFDFDVDDGEEGVALTTAGLSVTLGEAREHLAVDNPKIVGRHNLVNAAAAVAACALVGVPPSAWRAGLSNYAGIAHRLEFLGTAGGLRWFNDSKATNVDAALTAVKSFERGVHLIAGGVGKGASYVPLVEAARDRVERVYTVGEDAPAIAAAFAGVVDVVDSETLDRALDVILERAVDGDVVLLAPACASFDQYKSYAARGDAFRARFAALQETS